MSPPPSCDLSTQKEKNLKVELIKNRDLLGGTREAEAEEVKDIRRASKEVGLLGREVGQDESWKTWRKVRRVLGDTEIRNPSVVTPS